MAFYELIQILKLKPNFGLCFFALFFMRKVLSEQWCDHDS